jgi:hypothetical protein
MIHQPVPDLSPTEWQAVSIALRDAETGASTAKGPFAKLVSLLTGNEPATPLADPRLEAVRSFVVDTRRHRHPSPRLVPVLTQQGFNDRQIEALALLAA